MRILILNPEFPFPAVTGGELRTFELLKSLVGEHEVTLACVRPDSATTQPDCPFPLEVMSCLFRATTGELAGDGVRG